MSPLRYSHELLRSSTELLRSSVTSLGVRRDLRHHPPSYASSRHTFRKQKPKKKGPTIEGRTTFKNFLASFTLHNTKKLKKLNGFKLFDEFVSTLQKYLQEHNGIKFYFNARFEMHRKLPVVGEVIEKDKEWWRTSNIHSVNDLIRLIQRLHVYYLRSLLGGTCFELYSTSLKLFQQRSARIMSAFRASTRKA
eukprot:SAG11_NODE_3407_length_2465_cov_8.333897_3_plen_193_part_00